MEVKKNKPPMGRGRPKGSLNKRTIFLESLKIEDILIKHNVRPIEDLLKILPLLEPKDQAKIYLEMQSFIQAKPRSFEMPIPLPKPQEDEAANASTEQLLQIVRNGS